jgi:peptidoglycan/LPS O-acetylase OafA/YrhL
LTTEVADEDNTDQTPGPGGREYINSLTGLRGVAALSVFLYHYGALHPGIRLDLSIPLLGILLQTPIGLGFVGVDLFFVLSGFLLSLPFAHACLRGEKLPLFGPYLRRRVLRVFPAYYFQWGLMMLIGAWFVTWVPLNGRSVLAHFLMLFNIGPNPVSPVVSLWWSLPVEFSFYLLLPLIAVFMRPRPWLVLLLIGLLVSVVFRAWATAHFADSISAVRFLTASQLPGSLPLFLLGASAAMLVKWMQLKNIRPPSPKAATLLFLTGATLSMLWLWKVVLVFGDIYWDGHWSMIVAPVVQGASMSMLVLALYWGSRMGTWLCANRLIYFIGVISYSLYLWHFPVMQQIQMLGGDSYMALPGLAKFLLTTLITIAVASLSYFLIERPFSRLRGKRRG